MSLTGHWPATRRPDAFDRWFVRTYGPDGLGRPDHRPKEAKPPSPTRMRAQRVPRGHCLGLREHAHVDSVEKLGRGVS